MRQSTRGSDIGGSAAGRARPNDAPAPGVAQAEAGLAAKERQGEIARQPSPFFTVGACGMPSYSERAQHRAVRTEFPPVPPPSVLQPARKRRRWSEANTYPRRDVSRVAEPRSRRRSGASRGGRGRGEIVAAGVDEH